MASLLGIIFPVMAVPATLKLALAVTLPPALTAPLENILPLAVNVTAEIILAPLILPLAPVVSKLAANILPVALTFPAVLSPVS